MATRHNAQCFLPIMLALCLMLFSTYYAPNYASIVGASLVSSVLKSFVEVIATLQKIQK